MGGYVGPSFDVSPYDPRYTMDYYRSALRPSMGSNPTLIFRNPRRGIAQPPPSMDIDYDARPTVPPPGPIAPGGFQDVFSPSQPNPYRDIYMPQISEAAANYRAALQAPHGNWFRQLAGGIMGGSPVVSGLISGELGRNRRIAQAAGEFDLANEVMQANQRADLFPLTQENMRSNIDENRARSGMLRAQTGLLESPQAAMDRRQRAVELIAPNMLAEDKQRYILNGEVADPIVRLQLENAIRHQQIQEATDIRGQDITREGHFLTDRRIKEQNEIAREVKYGGAMDKEETTVAAYDANMDRLITTASELLNHPGMKFATGIPGKFWDVPGLPGGAADFKAKLSALKTMISFGTLQDLKNASKTGGAIGQVSDMEEKMLGESLGSLDRSQSNEEIRASLQRIIDFAAGSKARAHASLERLRARGPSGVGRPADTGATAPQQPIRINIGGVTVLRDPVTNRLMGVE